MWANEPVTHRINGKEFDLWLRNADLMQRPLNASERLFYLLEDHTCCSLAYYISIFMLLLIVVSVFALMCESLGRFNEAQCEGCEPTLVNPAFDYIELTAVCIFTMEYICRLAAVARLKGTTKGLLIQNPES